MGGILTSSVSANHYFIRTNACQGFLKGTLLQRANKASGIFYKIFGGGIILGGIGTIHLLTAAR